MIGFSATMILLGSLVLGVLEFLGGVDMFGILFSLILFIMSVSAYFHKDNVSLGTLTLLYLVMGFFFMGGLVPKVVIMVLEIFSIVLICGEARYKKKNYPYLSMTDSDLAEERTKRVEREAAEKKASEEAEAKEEEKTETTVEEIPVAEAEEAAPEEAEAPVEEVPAEKDDEEAPEEAEAPLEVETEEEAEEAPAEEPVPGLTEEISSEGDNTDEDGEEWYSVDEKAKPSVEDDGLMAALRDGSTFTSTRLPVDEKKDPVLVIVKKNGVELEMPEEVKLEKIFDERKEKFDPTLPFILISATGWGLDGSVKIVRYSIRNRSKRTWTYLAFTSVLTGILGEEIDIKEDSAVSIEKEILPGETVFIDVPSKLYGRTRHAELRLKDAVTKSGEILHYDYDAERMIKLPSERDIEDVIGEDTEEFLDYYEDLYKLGFKPEHPYDISEDGNACSCPCCGEVMSFDEKLCPSCGAPHERFIYCSPLFMKRCYERWTEKVAKEKARALIHQEKLADLKEEKERLEKKLTNKNNTLKMWVTVLLLILIVGAVYIYYRF